MVDFANRFLDPQGVCGQTLLVFYQSMNDFEKNYGYIEFVTTPGTFNLNFPKNHDFDDRDKAFNKILNLRRSVDPGWYGDVKRYQKRDLESSCSSAMTESVIRVISQGSRLNRHTTLE